MRSLTMMRGSCLGRIATRRFRGCSLGRDRGQWMVRLGIFHGFELWTGLGLLLDKGR